LEPHHPDFFWYGIHGVEPLFTIMGSGCESVTRVQTEGTDMAVGVWQDGRIGTFRGIRAGQRGYGSTVFGTKGIVPGGGFDGYEPLIVEIIRFFKTGKPPSLRNRLWRSLRLWKRPTRANAAAVVPSPWTASWKRPATPPRLRNRSKSS
jgi:hypothetical protein